MLIIDFLLLTSIIVCVVYSWMLNRRIQDLQNSRVEFARMVKELNISIMKAESSVADLGELSKVTSGELKNAIEEAKNTIHELSIINDLSNNIADQLGEQLDNIKEEQKKTFSPQKQELRDAPLHEGLKIETECNEVTVRSAAPQQKEPQEEFYLDKLKNFLLSNITHKQADEESISMNQSNYYGTLRKISVRK